MVIFGSSLGNILLITYGNIWLITNGLRGRLGGWEDHWWRLRGRADVCVSEDGRLHKETIWCVRGDTKSCVWQGWSCEAEQDGLTARPVRWWANWWREDMINPNALRKIVG